MDFIGGLIVVLVIAFIADHLARRNTIAKQEPEQRILEAKQEPEERILETQQQTMLSMNETDALFFSTWVTDLSPQMCGQQVTSKLSLLDIISKLLVTVDIVAEIEAAVCLHIDADNRIIDIQHWSGNTYSVIVPPQEIVGHAAELGSVAVAVAHSHPCSDSTPSEQDILHAAYLHTALETVGIRLIEHYVWCGDGYRSVVNSRRFKELMEPI